MIEMNGFADWRVKGYMVLLAVLIGLSACEKAQDKSATSVAGGEFNQFFPNSGNGFNVVFTQEKPGMAQAKLKRNGKEVAMLTIADLTGNPGAADKFNNSTSTLSGYPTASSGSKGTVVLVENRFQVQVRSSDDSFTEKDRKAWLQRFNLNGLATLK